MKFGFDLTISLQTIISILSLLLIAFGGAYKLIWNHMSHMEDRLMLAICDVRQEVKALELIMLKLAAKIKD